MKPIIFNYSKKQRIVEFPILQYDRKLSLNYLNGEMFIKLDNQIVDIVTKTHTIREADDERFEIANSCLDNYLTKTDANRERDDVCEVSTLYFLTKTEAIREQDE